MDDEKIENLWKWFFNNEQKVRDCVEKESTPGRDYIVENLDNLILDLGRYAWEIGVGAHKKWSFTISPNGDLELLIKSKEIIESCPDLKYWEFNYCKLARAWDRKFTLYDDDFEERLIDASGWKFVALKQNHDKVKLILQADNIDNLDDNTSRTAADLVVINEIGEEAKIFNISAIDIVGQLEPEHDSLKAEIKCLRKHISEI